jgi:hypothetical protein
VLINITGGLDLTIFEVNEASSIIREAADEDANIIFGAVIDETMRDEMKITVIATGFEVSSVVTKVAPQSNNFPFPEPDQHLADALIVWNPQTVDPDDYVALIVALGDLVRSEGGIGIERIGHLGTDISVSEGMLV